MKIGDTVHYVERWHKLPLALDPAGEETFVDHIVLDGRVVSFGDDTVAVWSERDGMRFLLPADALDSYDKACNKREDLNTEVFGRKGGRRS